MTAEQPIDLDDPVVEADLQAGGEWINTVRHPDELRRMAHAYNNDKDATCLIYHTAHGYGLFARKPFKKGDVIGEYPGPDITDEVADACPDEYDRFLDSPREGYAIGGNWMKADRFNFCSFINDPGYRGTQETGWLEPQFSQNCQAFRVGDRIEFWALRKIDVGEELLFHYGRAYWEGHPTYYPKGIRRPRVRASKQMKFQRE